jgi:hypothetical protein
MKMIKAEKMFRFFLVILVFQAPVKDVIGANCYIDSNAQGANNGTSWTDAWTNVTAVDYTSMSPGDVINWAGGTYSGAFRIGNVGVPGNPLIIKKSQEAGKDGTVFLNGAVSTGNMWWTLDGANDDSYTNSILDTLQVRSVTNNCGIVISNYNGSAINLTGVGMQGITLRWLNLSTTNGSDCYGFWLHGSAGAVSNNVIEYCYIHDVGQDAINAVSGTTSRLGDMVIRYNWLVHMGDDGIEWGVGGCDVAHCIIENGRDVRGHPDGIQSFGPNWRIYDNIIHDMLNSCMRIQWSVQFGATFSNLYVYGNVFYNKTETALTDPLVRVANDAGLGGAGVDTGTWSNMVFFNNTFFQSKSGTLALGGTQSGSVFTNTYLVNSAVFNNIFHNNTQYGFAVTGPNSTPQRFYYTTKDLPLDYNICSGTNVLMVSYGGVNYPSVLMLDAARGFAHNRVNTPLFTDLSRGDASLQSGDPAARNSGTNLTSLYGFLPDYNIDLAGNTRGLDGAWDIGAYELTSSPRR